MHQFAPANSSSHSIPPQSPSLLMATSPLYVCECVSVSWKVKASVTQSCPTLCDPMDCSPPGSSVHRILQARILEWVAIRFTRGSSWPRNRTWVSCIAGSFLTDWAMREAQIDNSYWLVCSHIGLKNTGVGSLSLLLQIFLTQELNRGLLHCRQIVYQLSY